MNHDREANIEGTEVRPPETRMRLPSAARRRHRLLGPAAALATGLVASSLAVAGPAEMAESARCSMCHHSEAQRVGPSWAAIAERYAGDDGAVAMLAARARAGGSGEWGKAPMPPVSEGQLSDADLEAVIGWILDR